MKHIQPVSKAAMSTQEILSLTVSILSAVTPLVVLIADAIKGKNG